MKNNFIKKISHYGDILAIPFFALLVIYFYNIEHKTTIEYVLLLFSISGFLLDIFFTYLFLSRNNFYRLLLRQNECPLLRKFILFFPNNQI